MKRNEVYETFSGLILVVMVGLTYACPYKKIAAGFFLLLGVIVFLSLSYASCKKIGKLSLGLIKCECMGVTLVMMISALTDIHLTQLLILMMLFLLITAFKEISRA